MIRVCLLSTPPYEFNGKTYANTIKVGEFNGKDVVEIITDDSEADYLAACDGYLGNGDDMSIKYPEILINIVHLAGESELNIKMSEENI